MVHRTVLFFWSSRWFTFKSECNNSLDRFWGKHNWSSCPHGCTILTHNKKSAHVGLNGYSMGPLKITDRLCNEWVAINLQPAIDRMNDDSIIFHRIITRSIWSYATKIRFYGNKEYWVLVVSNVNFRKIYYNVNDRHDQKWISIVQWMMIMEILPLVRNASITWKYTSVAYVLWSSE